MIEVLLQAFLTFLVIGVVISLLTIIFMWLMED